MNNLNALNLGVALCGSFCTFSKALNLIKQLVNMGVNVFPIMSYNAYATSTRFGKAEDFIKNIEELTSKKIIHTLTDAEPLGPRNVIDALLIAPCTGNTLAKLANAITDTPVLLAAKSLIRNEKPVILAVSTNDGLGLNLKNLGNVIINGNIFIVPMKQDDPANKPSSLVADFNQCIDTVSMAIEKKQIQPIFF